MATTLVQVTFDPVENEVPGLTASFDAASLQIVKSVDWSRAPTSYGDAPELNFSRGQGRRLSMRLHFEASARRPSVQPDLDALTRLAMIINPTGPEDKRRPPMLELVWPLPGALPAFRGAIDRVTVRYLVLLADGTPTKAEVDLEMEEASRLTFVR